MAHECFEDQEIADILNEGFISIKVDREERPDIDSIYMAACNILTGSGGWPLSIFMTPDKQPFFVGTYFPKISKWQKPGFIDIAKNIRKIWNENRELIHESAKGVISKIQLELQPDYNPEINDSSMRISYDQFFDTFDEEYGGFGPAPKFPLVHNLTFLMRYWKHNKADKALKMVEKTFQSIINGGMYDHVGGGIHRYATDKEWTMPHFEKMLYDQALLVTGLCDIYQITKNIEYKKAINGTLSYVMKKLTSPEGGFYSAEDADTEGVEGKFYLWNFHELTENLGAETLFYANIYNVFENGNYHDPICGNHHGCNLLFRKKSLAAIAEDHGLDRDELIAKLDSMNQKLYSARENRVKPFLDDKILTDWNGLMIGSYSRAATVLGDDIYLKSAIGAADFIIDNMYDSKRGILYHRYRDGDRDILGTIDDYSFLISGLLELYEACFDTKYIRIAIELQKILNNKFWDEERGGYFFADKDAIDLVVRKKEYYDGALPSGNSMTFCNLLKLWKITGDDDYSNRAMLLHDCFSSYVKQFPSGYTQYLCGLDFLTGNVKEIVVLGNVSENPAQSMLNEIRSRYIPNKIILNRNPKHPDIDSFANFTSVFTSRDDESLVFVCENYNCNKPCTNNEEVAYLLDE
jgi:uncharacterized protein YyaL (SSP411 family)